MAKSTLKFRDTIAAFEKLSTDIRARKFAPIYLLMGEESYFIDQISDMLAEGILSEGERAFNQLVMYGRDSDAGQVVNCCKQMPMMGEREVVIVKEAQNLRSIEKLAHYTSSPSPTTVLVICHKEKNIDKRSQLYKSIVKCGVVLESVRPRDYEIGAWLTSLVSKKGCTISPKALSMLVDNLGTDISKISNELTKLMLSLPSGTTQIEDVDIEQNIGISKDFNNFELCKAVLSRNMSKSLTIAEYFAHNPKSNPLLVTISVLFGQFKQLFIVNYLNWLSRQKGEKFPSDMELMRILKVNNPYAVAELKQASANWSNAKVFGILGLMREYDAKSKGINKGGASDGELLRELLLKIFAM
ncbi:MAG: DNA polymerase III subunit delta [Rikenellaceae bacterium]